MKNPERKIITAVIFMLIISVNSCDELFPQFKGRTNPADPYCPVQSLMLLWNSSANDVMTITLNFQFRDYGPWGNDEDQGIIVPQFFVLKFSPHGEISSVEDGRLVWANSAAAELGEPTHSFSEPFNLAEVWEIPPETDRIVMNAAIFWAAEFRESMNTLYDIPATESHDYSGDWWGPVNVSLIIDVVRPEEAGTVNSTSKSFGSSVIQLGPDQPGIFRYNMDKYLSFPYNQMFLLFNIENFDYGSDMAFNIDTKDMIGESWSSASPAADLYNMTLPYTDAGFPVEMSVFDASNYAGTFITGDFYSLTGNTLTDYDWKSGIVLFLTAGAQLDLSGPQAGKAPVFLLVR